MSPDMPPPNQLAPNTRFTIGDFDVSFFRWSKRYVERELINLLLSFDKIANFEYFEWSLIKCRFYTTNGDVWLLTIDVFFFQNLLVNLITFSQINLLWFFWHIFQETNVYKIITIVLWENDPNFLLELIIIFI